MLEGLLKIGFKATQWLDHTTGAMGSLPMSIVFVGLREVMGLWKLWFMEICRRVVVINQIDMLESQGNIYFGGWLDVSVALVEFCVHGCVLYSGSTVHINPDPAISPGFTGYNFQQTPYGLQYVQTGDSPQKEDSTKPDNDVKATDELPEDDQHGILEGTRNAISGGVDAVNSLIVSVFHGAAKTVGGAAGIAKDVASGFMEEAGKTYTSVTTDSEGSQKDQKKPDEGNTPGLLSFIKWN
uniref:Senescence domain-containing protein n=1 Tax=Steinernema glaseri TaxID=37863 RepID=A0A1I7ZVV1_9BILA